MSTKRESLEEQRRGLRLRIKVRETACDWKAVGELASQLGRLDKELAALPASTPAPRNIVSSPTVKG